MSTPTVEYTTVHPSEVRSFAREQGLPVGSKGLFSDEVKRLFNRGKRGAKRYDEHKVYAPSITVTVKPKGKPPVRRTFAVPALRQEMTEAGYEVGERGRIPLAKAQEYVLSTL